MLERVKKDVLQLSNARNFEGTETSGKPYFKFPTTVFFLLFVSTLNTICIGLFSVLTNKSSLRCSVLHSRLNWTVLLRLLNVTVRATIILGVCESCSGRFNALQRRHFLHKNFNRCLIICLPGVSHAWEMMMEAISDTFSDMRLSYIWGNVRTKLALHLGLICNWPVFIIAAFCPENC